MIQITLTRDQANTVRKKVPTRATISLFKVLLVLALLTDTPKRNNELDDFHEQHYSETKSLCLSENSIFFSQNLFYVRLSI